MKHVNGGKNLILYSNLVGNINPWTHGPMVKEDFGDALFDYLLCTPPISNDASIIKYVGYSNGDSSNVVVPYYKYASQLPPIVKDLLTPPNCAFLVSENHYMDSQTLMYILNTVSTDLPEAFVDMINSFINKGTFTLQRSVVSNTDGNPQSYWKVRVTSTVFYNQFFITSSYLKEYNGTKIDLKGETDYFIFAPQSQYQVSIISAWDDSYIIKSDEATNLYAPEIPFLTDMDTEGGRTIRVVTSKKSHGIVKLGDEEFPFIAHEFDGVDYYGDIIITRAGSYQGNCISVCNIKGKEYSASGADSNTLMIETKSITVSLSFNEYTGALTGTASISQVIIKYLLKRKEGSDSPTIAENDTGIFQIVEAGEYQIVAVPQGVDVYSDGESDWIEIEATLDTPNAYVDLSNPSQLGFDEVENVDVYDIYRVGDDGEGDELVESVTVGVSAKARSVKRAEKMFRVVMKDDGYSL